MKTNLVLCFPIQSQILGDILEVKIALPESYNDLPQQKYSSIYLLDASYFFDDDPGTLDEYLVRGEGMTNIVHDLIKERKIPPSILIGIDYSEEQRMKYCLEEAPSFYRFFTEELIPVMESKFRVSKQAKDRVLFGYSGSGHFSTYALLNDVYAGAETFGRFISISGVYDPSLPACQLEETIFTEMGENAFKDRNLYMALGADDPKEELANAHREFAKKLTGRGYSRFNLKSVEFPGKGHYDIPEFGFREGLIQLNIES